MQVLHQAGHDFLQPRVGRVLVAVNHRSRDVVLVEIAHMYSEWTSYRMRLWPARTLGGGNRFDHLFAAAFQHVVRIGKRGPLEEEQIHGGHFRRGFAMNESSSCFG